MIHILRRLLVPIAVLLVLAGCVKYTVPATVLGKQYIPSSMQFIPMMHSDGKTTYTTLMPMYYPERWEVQVCYRDTSYREWWGAKRKHPMIYEHTECIDVSPSLWRWAEPGREIELEKMR